MTKYGNYNLPEELYYHNEHAWAKIEEDGKVRVGMNDMFQSSAGDIVYIDLPFEGDEVEQGETCGKLQSAKWVGKLISPISGEIVEINEELEDDSTLVNKDPYGEGWIMLVEPANLEEELANLMYKESVQDWILKEIKKSEDLQKDK